MKIYFAGSIRGGRSDVKLYRQIIRYLKNFGEVLTEHIGTQSLTKEDDNNRVFHDRDLKWLASSDVIIAEVTTPSLGVGYEIAKGVELSKRVLCLFQPHKRKKLSAMIAGCPDVTNLNYRSLGDAKKIITLFIEINDEFVDVIDESNNVVGKELKYIVHRNGSRHRISAVLLRRRDGKYLIPTASKKKVEAGKLYHSAAGHVSAGESYQETAKRELLEEVGIKAENLSLIGTFWFEKDYPARKEKERFEVYEAEYMPEMGNVKLNSEQVGEKWLSKDELKSIYNDRPDNISDPLKRTCKYILKF